jgi:hypothetical protein
MIRIQRRRKVAPWPCAGVWHFPPWRQRQNQERLLRDMGPFAPTRRGRRVPRLPTQPLHINGPPGWITRRGWHALMVKAWGFRDA